MDISKASNFERFVCDLLERDTAQVNAIFGEGLSRQGFFDLSSDPRFAKAAAFIRAKSCSLVSRPPLPSGALAFFSRWRGMPLPNFALPDLL